MSVAVDELIQREVTPKTWFGVGGAVEMYAEPTNLDALRQLLRAHDRVRILGDGANLLVDDGVVDGLVVSLRHLNQREIVSENRNRVVLRVGAGEQLPKLIGWCVKSNLSGLEGLSGIPASVGGAAVMNAGGKFAKIGGLIQGVRTLSESNVIELGREELHFGYRSSNLGDSVIVSLDLLLERVEGEGAESLRARHREATAYKRATQPMGVRSAGCAFKNALIDGERVSAGMLIDRAGCKGERVGGAGVSDVHANFVTTTAEATARDIIELMRLVRARVLETHGVLLEPEVVIWSNETDPLGAAT